MGYISHLLFFLMGAILQNAQSSQEGFPTDCSYIKYTNPSSESGVYKIKPPGQELLKVYCDMSESIGWTKILQISTPYTVTRNGSGKIARERCFTASAKMSDASINAIRLAREEVGEPGMVHYRVTTRDTSDRVYMKAYKKEFNDLAAGWNIFHGVRNQCFASSLEMCNFNYFKTTHATLDTMVDGSSSGQTRRFFTDYQGSTQNRCYAINSPNRCVSRGDQFDHIAHNDVELWIGK